MLSVIIPARNAATLLPMQLEALASQNYGGQWEAIVADNGSSDGTRQVAERWRDRMPKLTVVDASSAKGINVARNAGARRARGDVLLFCDADDVVAPGWLAAMAVAAEQFDGWGGRLDEETLNPPHQLMWRGKRLQTGLTQGFLPHPQGANCGVRASAYAAVGGFNEDYVIGATEIEFFWRIQLAGMRVGFAPDAVVMYRHRGSLLDFARQQYRYGKSTVRLYRDFGPHGMRRGTIVDAAKAWGWLLFNAPRSLVVEQARGRWVRLLSRRVGRLRACIQFGLFVP